MTGSDQTPQIHVRTQSVVDYLVILAKNKIVRVSLNKNNNMMSILYVSFHQLYKICLKMDCVICEIAKIVIRNRTSQLSRSIFITLHTISNLILSCMIGNVPKQIPDNHLQKFCKIINGQDEFCDDIKDFRTKLICQYEAHHIGKYKINKFKIS